MFARHALGDILNFSLAFSKSVSRKFTQNCRDVLLSLNQLKHWYLIRTFLVIVRGRFNVRNINKLLLPYQDSKINYARQKKVAREIIRSREPNKFHN